MAGIPLQRALVKGSVDLGLVPVCLINRLDGWHYWAKLSYIYIYVDIYKILNTPNIFYYSDMLNTLM